MNKTKYNIIFNWFPYCVLFHPLFAGVESRCRCLNDWRHYNGVYIRRNAKNVLNLYVCFYPHRAPWYIPCGVCRQKNRAQSKIISSYFTQYRVHIFAFRLRGMKLDCWIINSCNLRFVNTCILSMSNNLTFLCTLFSRSHGIYSPAKNNIA